MKKTYKFIFDLDGTLYSFDNGKSDSFVSSRFYTDLKTNIFKFFMKEREIDFEEAVSEYERIKHKYNGEVSLGVEAEYGINRYTFFDNTWNLEPSDYIEKDKELSKLLDQLKGNVALLTAAPKIWTLKVLNHLEITDAFEGRVYTGEHDLRKPNRQIFQNIADNFGTKPNNVFSIGDQEFSDITPAKSIGMKTVFIGKGNTNADFQVSNVKLAIELLRREHYI